MPPGLIHVLQLLLGLLLPEEVQGRGDLHLPPVVQDHHHEEAQDEAESENHPSLRAGGNFRQVSGRCSADDRYLSLMAAY